MSIVEEEHSLQAKDRDEEKSMSNRRGPQRLGQMFQVRSKRNPLGTFKISIDPGKERREPATYSNEQRRQSSHYRRSEDQGDDLGRACRVCFEGMVDFRQLAVAQRFLLGRQGIVRVDLDF